MIECCKQITPIRKLPPGAFLRTGTATLRKYFSMVGGSCGNNMTIVLGGIYKVVFLSTKTHTHSQRAEGQSWRNFKDKIQIIAVSPCIDQEFILYKQNLQL